MNLVVSAYALERFNSAVECLIGLGSLQDRIRHAFVYLHPITGKFLGDADMNEALTRIVDKCTHKQGDPLQGTVGATCAAMSDEEALDVAREIALLQTKMARFHWTLDIPAK